MNTKRYTCIKGAGNTVICLTEAREAVRKEAPQTPMSIFTQLAECLAACTCLTKGGSAQRCAPTALAVRVPSVIPAVTSFSCVLLCAEPVPTVLAVVCGPGLPNRSFATCLRVDPAFFPLVLLNRGPCLACAGIPEMHVAAAKPRRGTLRPTRQLSRMAVAVVAAFAARMFLAVGAPVACVQRVENGVSPHGTCISPFLPRPPFSLVGLVTVLVRVAPSQCRRGRRAFATTHHVASGGLHSQRDNVWNAFRCDRPHGGYVGLETLAGPHSH